MGDAKGELIQQDEHGWASTDSSVCVACVDEPALKAVVAAEAQPDQPCTFCGGSCSAPLDTLIAAFVRGIERMHYRAIDELSWNGREGGWQGASTVDSWDLVDEFGDCFSGDGVREAVRDSVEDGEWVAKDFARPSVDTALIEGWTEFCRQVKYETRYVIWRKPDESTGTSGGEIPPAKVLDAVGQLVYIFPENLVRECTTDTQIWRARPHEPGKSVSSSQELGSTPTSKSRTNRMSPAGIPMFYAALDPETAELEATQGQTNGNVSIGAFHASRAFTVLDLANLREPPSVFADDGDNRPQWLFLHAFAKSLRAKPELPDIDYVPTQIVTEYFLKVFADGDWFDGLLYPSDVEGGGSCLVLNVPNERCIDHVDGWADTVNELALALDIPSVKTRALPRSDAHLGNQIAQAADRIGGILRSGLTLVGAALTRKGSS